MSSTTRSAHGFSTPVDDWWESAWCAGMDRDLFFDSETRPLALHYCRYHCPVVRECLKAAVENPPAYAVQGGVAFNADAKPFGYQINAARTCGFCGAAPGEERCGTPAGYSRHRRLREPTCGPCRSAHAVARARRRSAGRVLLGTEGGR